VKIEREVLVTGHDGTGMYCSDCGKFRGILIKNGIMNEIHTQKIAKAIAQSNIIKIERKGE